MPRDPSRETAPSPSGTRRRVGRVLIVDDERHFGEALHEVLSSEYEVAYERYAGAALSRLQAGEWFDVVLCDVMMPVVNGVELYELLSASVPLMASRIVFVTGGGFTPKIEAALSRIPNLILEKPVDIEALRALIERRVCGEQPRGRAAG